MHRWYHTPTTTDQQPQTNNHKPTDHHQVITLDLKGDTRFEALLIDSPGWGDTLSLRHSFGIVTRHIDAGCAALLREERRAVRDLERVKRTRRRVVDVVLYIFSPHRCKGIDVALLKQLGSRATIVPVLAKSDTMTASELKAYRAEVREQLNVAGVQVACPPFAVICAEDPPGQSSSAAWKKEARGRRYPWGMAPSEASSNGHSELAALRRYLLTDGLADLKQRSRANYERYRRRVLEPRLHVRCRRAAWRVALSSPLILATILAALTPAKRTTICERLVEKLPPLPAVRVSWHKLQYRGGDEAGADGRAGDLRVPLAAATTRTSTPAAPPTSGLSSVCDPSDAPALPSYLLQLVGMACMIRVCW